MKKINSLIKVISKQELFNYYVLDNHQYNETVEHFKIQPQGLLHSLLKYYNIKKPRKLISQSRRSLGRDHESYLKGGKKSMLTQKNNWANKSEDEKIAWSKKQQLAHSSSSFKTLISKINKDYQKNLDSKLKASRDAKRKISCKKVWKEHKWEILHKMHISAKKNRKERVCRTAIEQKVYDKLIEIYPDLLYDVKVDDRYPYFVDFYIPSKDLFIELNAHPSHGTRPWNGDIDNIEVQGNWQNTYIKRDPEKLSKAINSKLHYIRIYPYATLIDNFNINNFKFNDIIELLFNSISSRAK